MLFEARVRYLLAFLPLLFTVSGCGMWQYAVYVKAFMGRRGNDTECRVVADLGESMKQG